MSQSHDWKRFHNLRSWYNGARDQTEDLGGDITGMDSAEEVKELLKSLKENPDAPSISKRVEPSGENGPAGAQGQHTMNTSMATRF